MTFSLAAATWPQPLDWLPLSIFFALAIGLPILGYLFLYWDVRRWWRSLRRALVRVAQFLPDLPEWARRDTPRCVAALGLRMPCSEEQIKAAYRAKVKLLHPDHGGDKRRFLWLQSQFEEALALLEAEKRANHPR
ncbi:MAG TPA: J domain-containing protein [Pirellulales bacterium]|nr:J domain-containing protein [Pirellulales bacterium]